MLTPAGVVFLLDKPKHASVGGVRNRLDRGECLFYNRLMLDMSSHLPANYGLPALLLAAAFIFSPPLKATTTEQQTTKPHIAEMQAEQSDAEAAKRKLAEKGIPPEEYNSALICTVYNDDAALMQLLLAAGADVNYTDSNGCSALWRAAGENALKCMDVLLKAPGIDVNKRNGADFTPLIEAAYSGQAKALKRLLETPGVDIRYKAQQRWGCCPRSYSALDWAIRNANTDCVRLLLEALGNDKDGWSELDIAVVTQDTKKLKTLIRKERDINKEDKFNETLLYRAASNGLSRSLKVLVTAPGIQINKKALGVTPLQAARNRKQSECARILRKAGAK